MAVDICLNRRIYEKTFTAAGTRERHGRRRVRRYDGQREWEPAECEFQRQRVANDLADEVAYAFIEPEFEHTGEHEYELESG